MTVNNALYHLILRRRRFRLQAAPTTSSQRDTTECCPLHTTHQPYCMFNTPKLGFSPVRGQSTNHRPGPFNLQAIVI